MGLGLRTNKAAEMTGAGKIAAAWKAFVDEHVQQRIANQVHATATYAAYYDYASDEKGDYSFALGAAVRDGTAAPSGMVIDSAGAALEVDAARRSTRRGRGSTLPPLTALVSTWLPTSMATTKKKKKKKPAAKKTKATPKKTKPTTKVTKGNAVRRAKAPTAVHEMPRRAPGAGTMIWHNPVHPFWFDQLPGDRGFRVYKQPSDMPEPELIPCDCGWAPQIGAHYRPKAVPWTKNHRVKPWSWQDDVPREVARAQLYRERAEAQAVWVKPPKATTPKPEPRPKPELPPAPQPKATEPEFKPKPKATAKPTRKPKRPKKQKRSGPAQKMWELRDDS